MSAKHATRSVRWLGISTADHSLRTSVVHATCRIENGFYYDFDFKEPFTDKDLKKIYKASSGDASDTSREARPLVGQLSLATFREPRLSALTSARARHLIPLLVLARRR